jgi:aminomuconate-semialdehyde/2-hydroxymuconate-6-semialdehyde dehydrogenase
MIKILNYINGEIQSPISDQWIANFDPSIGEIYSQIPDSDERDVDLAYQAAAKAFPIWSSTSKEERSRIMLDIALKIKEHAVELALAESVDNGKPVSLANQVDIPRASSNMEFFATGILHYGSESHQLNDVAINYTLKKPIGVVGCISPWNLPLYLFTWKIAPALATGNTIVAKPSEITPMTAYLFSKICKEAGLPPGVLNIVHGYGQKVGAAITCHPGIKAISFTGGTKTGAEIAKTAAPMFKKLSLELGGKNPNIIFADCNFDNALKTTMLSSFANQGQICLCGSRIFIEKSIYNKFRDAFVKKTKNLVVGDPKDPKSKIGAVVSKEHQEKILSYVELAKKEGGKVLTGGHKIELKGRCENGYFLAPTIIEGLPYNCRTNQEEIFGPVVTITPFETEDEVVKYANSTKYGLSSILWTENLSRTQRLTQQLEAGIVWVNCWLVRDLRTPFGGVKESGVGREGGFNAFNFFTEQTNICIKQ